MSLQVRLEEVITAIGTDFKNLDTRLDSLESFNRVKVLQAAETPDPALPAGTVILRMA